MRDETYRQLLRGKGAHADPVASLADVPASVAGRKLEGYPHSIWQLVSHMNYWMEYELHRMAGQPPAYPEHAIESWPENIAPASEDEWSNAREGLSERIAQLAALSKSGEEVLKKPVAAVHAKEEPASVEDVLWQIMVHNSYHVGQIVTLLHCFGMWPPRTGADTW